MEDLKEWMILGMMWIPVGMTTVYALNNLFSRKIRDQEELQDLVDKEAEKLGIDFPIVARYTEYDSQHSYKPIAGYGVVVGGAGAKRTTIRHELYHIYAGHLDKCPSNNILERLDYYLRREPKAVIYDIFRIKL